MCKKCLHFFQRMVDSHESPEYLEIGYSDSRGSSGEQCVVLASIIITLCVSSLLGAACMSPAWLALAELSWRIK
jgi:hypothetical protein